MTLLSSMRGKDTIVTRRLRTGRGNDGLGKEVVLRTGNNRVSRVRAVVWRALTVLTCPCCIPIWVAVLSGTAAGALLTRNIGVTIVLFAVLFLLSAWKALRTYDRK